MEELLVSSLKARRTEERLISLNTTEGDGADVTLRPEVWGILSAGAN